MNTRITTVLAMVAAAGTLLCFSCEKERTGNANGGVIEEITNTDQLEEVLLSSGDTLLIFDLYTDWCTPCKTLSPVLKEIASLNHRKVRMYRVDIDKLPALAHALGVRNIPFVLFVKSGEAIYAITGVHPREDYQQAIDEFTPEEL